MAGSKQGSLQIDTLTQAYAAGSSRVVDVMDRLLARIGEQGEDHVWICRAEGAAVRARAMALDTMLHADRSTLERYPLFGIPFAVKDNIDVAGLPTTAACPGFAYVAERSATVVERLIAAGAVFLGKTNLDQFATGLVGTRSPYGVPRNPFDDRYIPGGSSSGSAVAVAAGLVSFALGTDTAGSGRVPAGCNNIVGMKPSRGLISAAGIVPACRSLDCVSIFALSAHDAVTVFDVAAGYDARDPFSRRAAGETATLPAHFRFGVPAERDLVFFGNKEVERLYRRAIEHLVALGGEPVTVDFAPFRQAAALLYNGPWVAERLAAIEDIVLRAPEAMLPVTREIIAGGAHHTAVDAFRAMYRLGNIRQRTLQMWSDMDVLVLPTAGTSYTIEQVVAEPITLNSNLGTYTNFVNLLDLAAHAVPCGFQADRLPVGITLVGPAFSDRALARLAASFQRRLDLPLGATGEHLVETVAPASLAYEADERVTIAVFGAHMRDLPLNGELAALGALFVAAAKTSPTYRMYALGGSPPRPGVLRVGKGEGAAIETELWSLTPTAFGRFVAAIPAPLCIGTIELADGRRVKGFLCEGDATKGCADITRYGGWRSYVKAS